ncbi:MAG TPA: PIN domain-containing protein [Chthoniobacterales bacterium]
MRLVRLDRLTGQLTVNLLRVLFVTFCATVGSSITAEASENPLQGLLIGLVFGLVLVLIDRLLKGFSLRAFSSATLGLLLGLFFAKLLLASQVLRYQSEFVQWTCGLVLYCAFGYLGTMLAMRSSRDEFSLIIPYVRFVRETTHDEPLVIDTNVIIDGRIADLCATGFLSRALIVPRFVLDELQLLADAREPMKRERGRRGLAILDQLQHAHDIDLTIHDSSEDSVEMTTDARLVRLAKILQARLLTNDQPLCQVARLQQVPVLNISDLARALRPSAVIGDELELALVKEGRDANQAVGYLPDGTLIVVNHARAVIGKTVRVVISSALQNSAGRLVFAELKEGPKGRPPVAMPAPNERVARSA